MYLTASQQVAHRVGLLHLINVGIDASQEKTHQRLTGNVVTSKQAYEMLATYAGLGFLQGKDEAGPVFFDDIVPRFNPTYTPTIRALGFKCSKQARNKDVYNLVQKQGPGLADSAVATENLVAANAFNLGFSGGTATTPDGKTVFASDHSLLTGTASNLGSEALSPTALQNAIMQVYSQQTDRGLMKPLPKGLKLIHGPLNVAAATAAVKSELLAGTNENDTNAMIKSAITEVVMEQYLGYGSAALSDMWAIVPSGDKSNPLFKLQMQGFMADNDKDIEYGTLLFVVDTEYDYFWMDWRGTYGTNP